MTQTIGFIGFGNMAQSIYKGIQKSNLDVSVSFFDNDPHKSTTLEKEFNIKAHNSIENLVQAVDTIILAVKPQHLDEVFDNFPNTMPKKCLISILAGTPISRIETKVNTPISIIRVMPNTPATLGQGMTVLCENSQVTSSEKDLATALFSSVGKCIWLKEDQLDIVTAISGSGPAFIYYIAQAIIDAGQKNGLDTETAQTLISQTLIGAGHMLQEDNAKANTLISEVACKGGTTEAGLSNLKSNAVDTLIQNAIQSAYDRAKEL